MSRGGPHEPVQRPADGLLTLVDAADFLRVHPRTVRAYIRRGLLVGHLIGGRWRFRRGDLDAFVDAAPKSWDWPAKPEEQE